MPINCAELEKNDWRVLCMELITVHVDRNDIAIFYCPFCGATKKVSVDKFKNIKHKITSRCKCDNSFQVQLNFRKNYRKTVTPLRQFYELDTKNVRLAADECL